MARKYRAYKNGQGFSAHDSDMPKQTWSKVQKRVDAKDALGKSFSIHDLKKLGWKVKAIDVPHARPTPPKPVAETVRLDERTVQQVIRREPKRHHIGWLIGIVGIAIAVLVFMIWTL